MNKFILFISLLLLLCNVSYAFISYPTQDTQTTEASPTTTWESNSLPLVRSRDSSRANYLYYEFDLSSANNNVTQANFTFYINNVYFPVSGVSFGWIYCNDTFTDSTLTWNNQDTEVINCNSTPMYNLSSTTFSTGWKTLDITDYVNYDDDNIFTIKVVSYPKDYDTNPRALEIYTIESASNDPYISFINGTPLTNETPSVPETNNLTTNELVSYLNNNIVSYYAFEENGFNYLDSSNNNNHLTMGNAPDRTTGILNYGQDFNPNNNDYIYATGRSQFEQDRFYVNLWMKPQGVDSTTQLTMGVFDKSIGNYYGWEFKTTASNNLRFATGKGDSGIDYSDTTMTLNNEIWYNVGLCFDGDTKIYINGTADYTLLQNDTQNPVYGNNDFSIGAQYQNGGFDTSFLYDGIFDEIAYINLTAYNGTCENLSTFFYNSGVPGTAQQYPFSNTSIIPDSCTYSGSGDWNISLSDNCNITSNINLENNTLFVTGDAGLLYINAEILTNQIQFTPDDFDGDSIIEINVAGGGSLSAKP